MASLGQKDEVVTKESLMKKYGLNNLPPEKTKKKKKAVKKKKSGLTTRQDIKSAMQRRKEALD